MLQPMAAIPELIAGRYRVQGKLARGGMGEVLAVTDVSTGAAVALKRMLPDLAEQRSLVVQFMREYHALSELRHPRIIEVYDYGVDRGAPFFTMEMLDGQDLGALSPLPYRDACRYLRDVASSLALLHARRMLHRDLSPRNVRLTSDGRCKVLDFGAMVPFGIPPNLTGTPPCIAPEALQGGPLDQRADLYSLGALAYTALTGRHAYAASQVSALPDVWMHAPPRPGRLVRDLPEALDALITGLMSMDPGKRPRTAGEVIELLTAIAGLEPDDSPAVARSFLVSSRLVGRDRACASLRSELANTMHGRGAALAIGGRAGTGRSRMLAEAALIAQTVGLSVVRLVARAQRGAASTLVGELVAGVWQAAPRESGRAIQDRPLVAELASTPVQPAAVSGEMRAQLLTQVVAYVCSVASERPLLISVDDLERADELSAALVAALAHQTSTCRLVLIASHDDKSGESLLAQVSDLALQLSLPELDRGQTTQLVASLFDDVPHVERVSEWLYRVARGNPKLTIELAEHLLNRGVVRYSGGVWVLPADIAEAVPPSTQEALLLRLRDVSPLATLLAEILCVRRGGAVVECFLDLAGVSSAVVFRALDELVRAGVFESAGDEYAFVQQELRDALARTLPPSRSQELHERWADWLLAGGSVGEDRQLEAGWHLVHTERALAGADLLAKVGPALVGRRVSMAAAIPAIERALVLYERHGRPLRECLRLRALLVLSSYLFDYRLAPRYAEATLNALYPFTGFAAIERLSRYLGKTLGFMVGVAWTALGWCFRWGPRRGPNVLAAIIDYVRCSMGMLGMHALAADAAGNRATLASMRACERSPLPVLSLMHAFAEAVTLNGEGRWADAKHAIERVLAVLRAGKPMLVSEQEYIDLLTGVLLLKGINASYREQSDALVCAQELKAIGTQLSAAAAMRICMTYHMCQAQLEATQHYRRLLDLEAIQHGTQWQVDWIAVAVEGLAGSIWNELPMLRRSLDRLEQLASELPMFVDMRDTLRIDYHFHRGDYARAAALGDVYVERHAPCSLMSWTVMYALTALAHVELGNPERAKAICERAMRHLSDEDGEYGIMLVELEAAYATSLAMLGERERAEGIFHARLARVRASGDHAREFQVLEHRVHMLRLFGERTELRQALAHMQEAAAASNNAALIAFAERVQTRQLSPSSPLPEPNDRADTTPSDQPTEDTSVTKTEVLRRVRTQ